nr:pentatricopeptide repeat-containing protein [Tanacetum cinerariifolium]
MIIKKDSEIIKAKVERKSLALKSKKEYSDEECLTFGNKGEECGDSNHLIRECPKPLKDKNQRAFVGGSWSDSGEEDDEKVKDETCLVAHASKEICLGVDLEPDEWIKDIGCSKHMTGNRKLFSTYKEYNGGNVIFGSNICGNIIVKGQICDNKCRVTFSKHDSVTTKDGRVIGYSQNSKAYIILNKHTRKVKESFNVTFDETPPLSKTSLLVDDDLDEDEANNITEKKNIENDIVDETLEIDKIVNIKESRNHPLENVIGNLNQRTLRWSLDELVYGAPLEGPYQTNLPSPDVIISYIQEDQEGQVTRIHHQEEDEVQDYQILTREIMSSLIPLEEIIWENVFCLGGNRDHVPACHCYMLYCVAKSEKFNLSYFMAKIIEWVTKQAILILPYGILLTRLFDFIIDENPKLQNESYVLYNRVINPLAAQLEQKPRRDRGTTRGCHSTSFSTFNQPSSSHLNDDDDDDGNNRGTSRASTPSPIRYVNSLTNEVP